MEMTKHEIDLSNETIEFVGIEIAEGSSDLNNAHPQYSGCTGKAESLRLYQTKEKYIAVYQYTTQWAGDNDYNLQVNDKSLDVTLKKIKDLAFGESLALKELISDLQDKKLMPVTKL